MGVRVTGHHVQDRSPVALYDSVTGVAFGEVFESADEAEAFLDWLRDRTDRDPRGMSPLLLADYRRDWNEQREAA